MDDPHDPTEAWRPYQTGHEWRMEVLMELRGIHRLLAELCGVVERLELPVATEPAAVTGDPPEEAAPLGTWILTDARVQAIEEAIEQEQRVRGRTYGG